MAMIRARSASLTTTVGGKTYDIPGVFTDVPDEVVSHLESHCPGAIEHLSRKATEPTAADDEAKTAAPTPPGAFGKSKKE